MRVEGEKPDRHPRSSKFNKFWQAGYRAFKVDPDDQNAACGITDQHLHPLERGARTEDFTGVSRPGDPPGQLIEFPFHAEQPPGALQQCVDPEETDKRENDLPVADRHAEYRGLQARDYRDDHQDRWNNRVGTQQATHPGSHPHVQISNNLYACATRVTYGVVPVDTGML